MLVVLKIIKINFDKGRKNRTMIDAMNASHIEFKSAHALAEFLAAFVPASTAVFEVHDRGNGQFTLTFTGGF